MFGLFKSTDRKIAEGILQNSSIEIGCNNELFAQFVFKSIKPSKIIQIKNDCEKNFGGSSLDRAIAISLIPTALSNLRALRNHLESSAGGGFPRLDTMENTMIDFYNKYISLIDENSTKYQKT